ncbi:hypothetical protein [Alkalinema sp. FACHB-956]|uniref:hypothetical protein n=1 Tax=Alkalinema sp. FACHB-956 TaxID=2692768 RepID=UPI001685D456|nr:hypothetical protein [Alkalinema sp. FACHB-956]MBD2327076.1 hypothetical protein [Alkalinema sp. FACHB-956]
MQSFPVTLVAGAPGVGKTTWIYQQASLAQSAAYLNLGAENFPIDTTYLSTECPQLTAIAVDELSEFLQRSDQSIPLFIELGFHIDPASLELPIEPDACRKILLVQSPQLSQSTDVESRSESQSQLLISSTKSSELLHQDQQNDEWTGWTCISPVASPEDFLDHLPTEAYESSRLSIDLTPETTLQIRRSYLRGKILDGNSLETFWDELTHGAYGHLQRAKGIFELVDGRALLLNYRAGHAAVEPLELSLPRWLEGPPDRFSGLEVVGTQLDQPSIVQTLTDCCLEDAAIAYYQAQIRASQAASPEVSQSVSQGATVS